MRGYWFCVRRPGLAGASSGLGAELEISVLFVMSILCLVLYGGSLSFAVFYLPLALINPAVYCFSVGRAE